MVEAHRNQAEYRPKSNSPPPTVKPVPLLLYVGNTSSPEQREYPPGATTGLFPHGAGVLQGHPLCLHHQHPQATKPCGHEYMLNFSSQCSCPISGKIFLALALAQADAKLGDPHELVLLPEGAWLVLTTTRCALQRVFLCQSCHFYCLSPGWQHHLCEFQYFLWHQNHLYFQSLCLTCLEQTELRSKETVFCKELIEWNHCSLFSSPKVSARNLGRN